MTSKRLVASVAETRIARAHAIACNVTTTTIGVMSVTALTFTRIHTWLASNQIGVITASVTIKMAMSIAMVSSSQSSRSL